MKKYNAKYFNFAFVNPHKYHEFLFVWQFYVKQRVFTAFLDLRS